MRVLRALVAAAFLLPLLSAMPALGAQVARVDASTTHLPLAPYLDVMVDPTARLDIADVTSPEVAARFVPFAGRVGPNYAYTASALWVRFAVENASDVPTERWLALDAPWVENVEVFRDGEPPAVQGMLHPRAERELSRRAYTFRIALAPHQVRVVHVRAWGQAEVMLPLELWEVGALGKADRGITTVIALCLGVMLAMALYNAFLFFFVADRVHLYYAVYVVGAGLWCTCVDGTLLDLLPDRVQVIPHWVNMASAYTGLALAGLFMRAVLGTRAARPRLDRWLLAVVVALLIIPVARLSGLIDLRMQNIIARPLMALAIVGWIAAAVVRWRDGLTAAGYVVFGWTALLAITVVSQLALLGIVPLGVKVVPLQIPFAVEAILFSLALADAARQRNRAVARLSRASARFVPHEFLALLGKGSLPEVRQGDQIEREMTVFFLDVHAFTSLVEKITPSEAMAFVNALFARLEAPISECHGFIDKFMGDGIMALFERADDAVAGAVACLEALGAFNAERAGRGERPVAVGIGLHTGPLMLGTVGGDERLSCTVLGDSVNLASRLERMTRIFGASVLLSDATKAALRSSARLDTRCLGRVIAKGKRDAITVHELLEGLPRAERDEKRATAADFEAACRQLVAGRIEDARTSFERCQLARPGDAAVAVYLRMCAERASGGTNDGWDGAVRLDVK
jgi:adenylate cyclase